MIKTDTATRKQLLSVLQKDLEAAKDLRRTLENKIARWKAEYNGDLYGNENPKRSKIVSRDIKKQSEWQHPAIVEPFLSTNNIIKANPVTWEDAEMASNVEILLNTQFCRQFSRYNFINKAVRVLDQEGTCITRTGWEYKEKTIEERVVEEVPNPEILQLQDMMASLQQEAEFMASNTGDPRYIEEAQMRIQEMQAQMQQLPETVEEIRIVSRVKPIKNHPTAVVCRNEDIFIDPTCQDDFENAHFIIHRHEVDMTMLKRAGIYKNLDKVNVDNNDIHTDADYDSPDITQFRFTDKPRQKMVMYEYWGNYDIYDKGEAIPIVCCWIGDTIIRLEENPFPDKKPPFIVTPFNIVPFTLYGESNAELLSDIQKIKTAVYRGFIDNMSLSNNGQKGIRMGALDPINKKRFLTGENFEFQGTPNDFYDGHFNELPGSAFNLLQLMTSEADAITGINSYGHTQANSNAIGNTATGIQNFIDATTSRRLNIVRNIAENLIKPLLRKWLAYDAEFLDEETQFRITNSDFVWIKRDDLCAEIDIDLTISTSDDNKATAQELAYILQTVGPNAQPDIQQDILAEICDLYRRPELAQRIRTYQPQLDPMAQETAQAQLDFLKAQIAEMQAKAARTEADVPLKEAKVDTEQAKADNLRSRTDSEDLRYLDQYNGTAHRNAMELEGARQAAKERQMNQQNQFKITESIFNNLRDAGNNRDNML